MYFFLQFLAQPITIGSQQVGAHQHFVVLGCFHVGEAQDQALVIQHPAALDHGTLVIGDRQQLVEILRAHQWTAEFQGDGKIAIVLVGIGAGQGEALDFLLLRGDRLATGLGKLPGFIALAGAQRQHGQNGNKKRAYPAVTRVRLGLWCRFHVHFPALIRRAV